MATDGLVGSLKICIIFYDQQVVLLPAMYVNYADIVILEIRV